MMNNNGENVLSPLPGNSLAGSRNNPHRVCRPPPPQPHMCVQDTLQHTKTTCFINVMSWGKISRYDGPDAPIPMYGGVLIPLSDRCCLSAGFPVKDKPLAFAVVANPHILQQRGKYAENPEERDWLIDLMLDFIEAMNEGLKFSRNFTVLKDRDLTGELKDIWNIIQAKREAEKSKYLSQNLQDENSSPVQKQEDERIKYNSQTMQDNYSQPNFSAVEYNVVTVDYLKQPSQSQNSQLSYPSQAQENREMNCINQTMLNEGKVSYLSHEPNAEKSNYLNQAIRDENSQLSYHANEQVDDISYTTQTIQDEDMTFSFLAHEQEVEKNMYLNEAVQDENRQSCYPALKEEANKISCMNQTIQDNSQVVHNIREQDADKVNCLNQAMDSQLGCSVQEQDAGKINCINQQIQDKNGEKMNLVYQEGSDKNILPSCTGHDEEAVTTIYSSDVLKEEDRHRGCPTYEQETVETNFTIQGAQNETNQTSSSEHEKETNKINCKLQTPEDKSGKVESPSIILKNLKYVRVGEGELVEPSRPRQDLQSEAALPQIETREDS